MTLDVWLAAAIPALPGLAGLAGLLLRDRARRPAAALAVSATALALLSAVVLGYRLWGRPQGPSGYYFTYAPLRDTPPPYVKASHPLADFGSVDVTLSLSLSWMTALIAAAVCAVALAVQVYSIGYQRDDQRYAPYAAQISLFTAAMLLVVVSDDLIMLLVGWEVMGLCSYLLIGHDRSLPEAPGAAVKAFVVTRVGDVGFLLGIVVLGVGTGSFNISHVLGEAPYPVVMSTTTLTVACLLLLAGVAGKSAQFPLHTWLPDAMAGPTPISALIHAATMVASGVYVVTRLFPLFVAGLSALTVLGVIASITMLLGACAALAQDDIKRVLAWSTVSQIAYMTGALAVASTTAATNHLLAHAAFKALLFLCAGAIIHAVLTNSMTGMGGLRRSMPVTFVTTTLGLAALAGFPPLVGFWTKEGVLGAAERTAHGETVGTPWVGWMVLIAALITTALTGAYATRLWLRTFFGAPRAGADVHPHDPPGLMRWPLILLAIPVTLGGALVLWQSAPAIEWGWFFYAPERLHGETIPSDPGGYSLDPLVAVLALGLTLAGALAAWAAWRRDRAADPARALGRLRPVFDNAFYLDAVQDAVVVRPVRAVAQAVTAIDVRGVAGAVTRTGRSAVGGGRALRAAHGYGLGTYLTAALGGGALLVVFGLLTGGWS